VEDRDEKIASEPDTEAHRQHAGSTDEASTPSEESPKEGETDDDVELHRTTTRTTTTTT
jgi:hypothetical protein